MFGNATQKLLRQVDQGGALIPVSRMNDSEKLKPLAVVIKRPAVWFWQSPKYKPTTFTLNDLLEGEPIEAVVKETEFLKFKETQVCSVDGSVEAGVGAVGLQLKAQAHAGSNLSAPLGTLHKDTVGMQKLLQNSKNRKVDLDHSLIRQTLGKSLVFTVVVERVFTSCECTLVYNSLKKGKCHNVLKALGIYPGELKVKQSFNMKYDTFIDLPAGSVLAYSVIKLDINTDGSYELSACFEGLQSDSEHSEFSIFGEEDELCGFEVEWPYIKKGSSLSVLKEVLSGVKATLSVLAQLPVPTRSSLLLLFRQILPKRDLLNCLEDKLEMFCRNPSIPLDDVSEELVKEFLDVLQSNRTSTNGTSTEPATQNGSSPALSDQNGDHSPAANHNGADQKGSCVKSDELDRPVLTALYMLVSAAEGLKDEGLILLENLCSPEELCGLNDLVNLLTDSEEPLPCDRLPAALQSDAQFLKVEALFSSGGVTLQREGQLWAEAESDCEVLPGVLCVVIQGLAFLNQDLI